MLCQKRTMKVIYLTFQVKTFRSQKRYFWNFRSWSAVSGVKWESSKYGQKEDEKFEVFKKKETNRSITYISSTWFPPQLINRRNSVVKKEVCGGVVVKQQLWSVLLQEPGINLNVHAVHFQVFYVLEESAQLELVVLVISSISMPAEEHHPPDCLTCIDNVLYPTNGWSWHLYSKVIYSLPRFFFFLLKIKKENGSKKNVGPERCY